MDTLQQQKRKFQGMNPSGTFRTNALVIAVTARQQKENLPRDEPLRDIPNKCTNNCGYRPGMNRSETSRTNAQVTVVAAQQQKREHATGMNR
jgi:hypothetical protein